MLQADSEKLRQAWIQAVQASIASAYRESPDSCYIEVSPKLSWRTVWGERCCWQFLQVRGVLDLRRQQWRVGGGGSGRHTKSTIRSVRLLQGSVKAQLHISSLCSHGKDPTRSWRNQRLANCSLAAVPLAELCLSTVQSDVKPKSGSSSELHLPAGGRTKLNLEGRTPGDPL